MFSAIEFLEHRRLLAAGDVDRSFGANGKILGTADLPPISQFSDIHFQSLLPQKDGKLLAVFRALEPTRLYVDAMRERVAIARFSGDGLLDRSFGDVTAM